MGAIGLAALAVGRPRAALPALAAAVAVLVLVDPELAGDAGFALSVLATGGLLLLAPGWRDGLRRRGVPAGFAEALAVPAAAQLACGPVVAGISGTVSLVAVPANLLVVPAIAPATVLGVAAAVVSPVWPAGAEFGAWLASWPAWWLVTVARVGARLPAGTLPWPGGLPGALLLAGLTLGLLLAVRRPLIRRLVAGRRGGGGAGHAPGPAGRQRVAAGRVGWWRPAPSDRATPSCCRWRPGGRWWSTPVRSRRRSTRCLRRLGVREVSLLVVSHFHADHIGGVAGVFRGRRVAAVLAPALAEPAAGRDAGRRPPDGAARHGGAGGRVGRTGRVGWRWSLLGPPYPMRGTRSDPNNNSLVLRATVAGVRIAAARRRGDRGAAGTAGPDAAAATAGRGAQGGPPRLGVPGPGLPRRGPPGVALVPVGVGQRLRPPEPGAAAIGWPGPVRGCCVPTPTGTWRWWRSGRLAVVGRGVPGPPLAGTAQTVLPSPSRPIGVGGRAARARPMRRPSSSHPPAEGERHPESSGYLRLRDNRGKCLDLH